jgi:chorismate--pyruvate lyase
VRPQPARATVAAWVGATGSLSARLARAHPPFSVRVLQQGRAPAWPGEHDSLDLPAHTPLLAREVILCGDGAPLVFARSVTSMQAAHGAWRAIQGLGTRPLAQLLFSRSEIRRTPLRWQWLPISEPSARAIARSWLQATEQTMPARGLWMRHSVFHRAGQALRVAECFLPKLVETWPRSEMPPPLQATARVRASTSSA